MRKLAPSELERRSLCCRDYGLRSATNRQHVRRFRGSNRPDESLAEGAERRSSDQHSVGDGAETRRYDSLYADNVNYNDDLVL